MNTYFQHRRHTLQWGVIVSVLALAGCHKQAAQAFHGIDITGAPYGTDFRLNDPDGCERTLADFKGEAVLIFFGFTQCPDVCPTALVRAAEVKRLQVLFVTVDPERDTPEVLKAYTSAFDPSFIGLYADLQRTAETAQDFKIFYRKVPTGASYTMDHTALSYVYDPTGRLRLALRHDQIAEHYADDVRRLLHPT
jgi:protein SCO1/2